MTPCERVLRAFKDYRARLTGSPFRLSFPAHILQNDATPERMKKLLSLCLRYGAIY